MTRRIAPATDAGTTGPVERAFADVLRRLDPATDPRVLRAAELAMRAVALGHAAFDLGAADPGDGAPVAEGWRAALHASPWVARPAPGQAADPQAPLVLEGDLLYLRRYREYERRLAAGLRRIAAQPVVSGDLALLAPLFAQLFPRAAQGDLQARAAALALVRPLLLLTGGPGTGKTTTIARLLLMLAAQHRALDDAPPRVALAAPTGRAADRMAQSLRRAVEELRQAGVDAALCDALLGQARTLHRLLGVVPDSPRFRHDADNPLAYDVVVVDEASMVDLPLMCKLVEAVPEGAALILIGDPDQLPSVEAGDVLASIVAAAGEGGTLPAAVEAQLAPLLGAPAAGDLFAGAEASPLAGHRVHLRRGWRQADSLALAPLAEAARAGDADTAVALMQSGTLRGVHFHAGQHDPLAPALRERLLAPWRALAQETDPARALLLAERARVLTALRDGPQGATRLNARIEEALAGVRHAAYFHGRLLLVTENSDRHRLFNGDIGVCLPDDSGAMVAWFAGETGVRGFHPAALPAHAGAFATTVHKAQGSEYAEVWLVLPRADARVLSRELVYTGLTRAREALHLCADETTLRAALGRRVQRVSGLRARLVAAS
ncbi:MAG TPA: exodeoxyribonuclease V subunit alpha [Xanthomonadaceae bacterium]|nr:exodeoxyribonuclease V subunit alpha [Xanthomonadaceae bacterium]